MKQLGKFKVDGLHGGDSPCETGKCCDVPLQLGVGFGVKAYAQYVNVGDEISKADGMEGGSRRKLGERLGLNLGLSHSTTSKKRLEGDMVNVPGNSCQREEVGVRYVPEDLKSSFIGEPRLNGKRRRGHSGLGDVAQEHR
jgi:hypothetical protein